MIVNGEKAAWEDGLTVGRLLKQEITGQTG